MAVSDRTALRRSLPGLARMIRPFSMRKPTHRCVVVNWTAERSVHALRRRRAPAAMRTRLLSRGFLRKSAFGVGGGRVQCARVADLLRVRPPLLFFRVFGSGRASTDDSLRAAATSSSATKSRRTSAVRGSVRGSLLIGRSITTLVAPAQASRPRATARLARGSVRRSFAPLTGFRNDPRLRPP